MATIATLLHSIDQFLSESEMAESTFGRKAVNDGKFVDRLRRGGETTLSTAKRVEAFIAQRQQAGVAKKRVRGRAGAL